MNSIEINPKYLLQNLNDFVILENISANNTSHHKIGCIKATGQKVFIENPANSNIRTKEKLIKKYNIECNLSHPILQMPVGFYNSEINQESCFITVYQKNGTLTKYLEFNEITNREKICLSYGIAKGIDYLHHNNTVHYKLVPNNILIDDDIHAIIKKYGIPYDNSNFDSEMTSNLVYLSPEVINGDEYKKSSDVYSFGLILYYIFTSRVPYEGVPIQQIINQKKNSAFDVKENIPSSIKKLIKKCTDPNPSERPEMKKIWKKLESKMNEITDDGMASQYASKLKIEEKINRSFRIPIQILKLPTIDQPWTLSTNDPIDYESIIRAFSSLQNEKIILINIFGEHECGKSTYLRNLTGNQAFYSGHGLDTTTLGILIDGPYKVEDILNNIFAEDFIEKTKQLNLPPNAIIYFFDTQGIGDSVYETKYKIVLERIHSILCAFSSICLNITSGNTSQNTLFELFKILRRAHFTSKGSYTKLLMLITNCDSFDNLSSIQFESIDNYQNTFITDYWNKNSVASKYYLKEDLIPIPFGNCKNNYKKYMYSIWYTFYFILQNMDEDKMIEVDSFILSLRMLNSHLFGESYQLLYNEIMRKNEIDINKEIDGETNAVIKTCSDCCHYLASFSLAWLNLISDKSQYERINEAIEKIEYQMELLKTFYLPYFLGEFNIPLDEYEQYSCEIIKDINSYLKHQSDIWRNHMKKEKHLKNELKDVGSIKALYYIPFVQIAYHFYSKNKKSELRGQLKEYAKIREQVRYTFKPTFYPLFWQSKMLKNDYSINQRFLKGKKYEPIYDIISKAGSNKLLIFFEQKNNDSTKIFRAITNLNVNFTSHSNIEIMFKDIPCKNILCKFKRYGSLKSKKYIFLIKIILILQSIAKESILSYHIIFFWK